MMIRHSLRVLTSVVLCAIVLTGCRNSNEADLKEARAELKEARVEGQRFKVDLDQAKADLENQKNTHRVVLANLEAELGRVPTGEVFPRPALEYVKDIEILNSIGRDRVQLYRWRGGILEGWIQFQTGDSPAKKDIEVLKKVQEIAADPDYKAFDPRAVSGLIMIALKTRTDFDTAMKNKSFITDCQVTISLTVGHPTKKESRGTGYTFSGSIDATKAVIDYPPSPGYFQRGTAVESYFGSGNPEKKEYQVKKFRFYELKVSTEAGK